jgi:hypothetical protein
MTRMAFPSVLSTLLVFGALACSKSTPAAADAPPAAEAPSPSTPAPEPASETPAAAEGKDRCTVLDMAMLRETLGATRPF